MVVLVLLSVMFTKRMKSIEDRLLCRSEDDLLELVKPRLMTMVRHGTTYLFLNGKCFGVL